MAQSNWMTGYRPAPYDQGNVFGATAVQGMLNDGYTAAAILAGKRKFGYTLGQGARGLLEGADKGNWLTDHFGDQGNFGVQAYENVKSLGHDPTEIFQAFGGSGLKIGDNVMAAYQSDMNAQRAKEMQERDHAFQQQMAEYAVQNRPLLRSGDPGAVGKPASGMKIAKGDEYSKGRRGSTLNRESAYFTNPLGGVSNSTGNKPNMNIR